jgi:hypothetical protein
MPNLYGFAHEGGDADSWHGRNYHNFNEHPRSPKVGREASPRRRVCRIDPLVPQVWVRFGSKADILPVSRHVRFTPQKQTSLNDVVMSAKCQNRNWHAPLPMG